MNKQPQQKYTVQKQETVPMLENDLSSITHWAYRFWSLANNQLGNKQASLGFMPAPSMFMNDVLGDVLSLICLTFTMNIVFLLSPILDLFCLVMVLMVVEL
jgi:hypothetical protein